MPQLIFAVPDNVKALCLECGTNPPPQIIFTFPDYTQEYGGVIASNLCTMSLPNTAKNPHKTYQICIEDLWALGDVPVLGLWHNHCGNNKPSPRDHKCARGWSRDGVPLYVIINHRDIWFWVDP